MSIIETEFEFQLPKNQSSQIKVMGVGGGGSNAVNYMFEHGIKGVDFVICNTDLQALEASPIPTKIQLGENLTEGLGAGSNPDVGMKAAQESADRINELLDANTKMLFITAGMGGGTGTGAAPVIAEIAREKGILTIAVVTHPFTNEGGYRKQYAKEGLEELKKQVDTLLIINNDKLIEVYGDLTLTQAFGKANEVLNTATKGIAEVISQHLLVNIDLNDARKVLENSGTAVMGQAQATGENRAIEAVTEALDSPLLNDNEIYGAEQVLLKIVTGSGDDEIKMSELSKIKNKIQSAAGRDVNIIEGIGIDPDLGSAVSVTVIATGFETKRVNDPITIDLESSDFSKDEEKLENNFINEKTDSSNVQQTLSLEEDSLQDYSETKYQNNLSSFKDKEYQNVEASVLVEEKIVLELEDEEPEEAMPIISLDLDEKIEEENSEEFISDILNSEEDIQNESNDNEIILNSDTETLTNANSMRVEARERENRLREISIKLRTPSGLTKLENEPAYKRSNVTLEKNTHSSENELSRLSLNKEGLQNSNKFLHDNVD
ncbi:MAG: cell division protein FtsZ [Flavobacteriales bacterium]|jgi:cell division protein FtsZ|tara:strand:- start:1867 stop:3513 length:1647 start_codon:yes stop_codon:yes gene_type:complete